MKAKALEMGFQLFGVSDLKRLESVDFPAGRGLMRPSEVMPNAKSAVVMGMVIWDEAMNTAVAAVGNGDFSGGVADYLNMYYEVLETRAWRIADWLRDAKNVKGIPTHAGPFEGRCASGRSRFHRTQHTGHNSGVWATGEVGGYADRRRIHTGQTFRKEPVRGAAPLSKRVALRQILSLPSDYPGAITGRGTGKKVNYDKCVISHEFDKDIDPKNEKHIRHTTARGFMECTICNLICPYGNVVDKEIIPKKRGMA